MEHSTIQLDNLPDEILMMIFKNMSQTNVLYSLIGVNQRLNTIVRDSMFTNHLTLREYISDDFINPSTDSMLDRFCSHILPNINDKIKRIDLDSSSMERILLATNYPSLYGLTLYNMDIEISMHYATGETALTNLFKNQILSLNIHENLPNLKCFSLYGENMTYYYDELIVPLLNRMINLEELGLYLIVSIKNTFVDGNDLKKNIINKMSRLNKFHFNIRSTIDLHNQINLPSNEDIQYTFKDICDNHIISCVNYFSETQQGQCHIYSYPYTLNNYYKITNNFPGGLIKCVSKISLYDERPFEHEFFLRIAQSFPLVKDLTLVNMKPQNGKQTDDNQNLPVIEYPHLTTLDLTKSHLDYIEQFLLDTKTILSSNVDLSVVYQALRKVTQKFKSNATRINCSKLSCLDIVGKYRIPKYVHEYFPHTEIFIC
ncbi:unnamed protein product [Rotaria sordida]|uniref:F-box domain-containing protein n=1 Tax=Rotaria sordida TaxID=392033 RepID=A0A815CXJ3_9BILA|nr:unnamed protein product [Rotaria sordida]CAF1290983.1 unnamed protein product [Rotaria sordida]CAF3775753.1 unnamed protein product [Rotaria sordida]CAF3882797.1 unnamed protein product [Rotaria sordida]